jgi:hypothetical protein
MLSGRSDVSQAVAGPFRLQLCAMLGNSGIKLFEYVSMFLNFGSRSFQILYD